MRALLASALLLVACSDADFPSRGLLEGYRVVALIASPPEIAPDGAARLFAVEHDPVTLDVAGGGSGDPYYVWSICLFARGAEARYACVDPRLEVARRTPGPQLRLDLGPNALDLDAWLEAARAVVGDEAVDVARREGLALTVRLVSGRLGAGRAESVRTVRVSEAADPNRNPPVLGIAVDGSLVAGARIALQAEVAADAAQAWRDGAGAQQRETLSAAWFTTDGALSAAVDPDGTGGAFLRLPDRAGPLRVYLVVRDDRGGASSASRDLIVTAAP